MNPLADGPAVPVGVHPRIAESDRVRAAHDAKQHDAAACEARVQALLRTTKTEPRVTVVDKDRHVRLKAALAELHAVMGGGRRYTEVRLAATAWAHEAGVVRGEHVPVVEEGEHPINVPTRWTVGESER